MSASSTTFENFFIKHRGNFIATGLFTLALLLIFGGYLLLKEHRKQEDVIQIDKFEETWLKEFKQGKLSSADFLKKFGNLEQKVSEDELLLPLLFQITSQFKGARTSTIF